MTAALEGGEWSAARPGRTLPLGRTRYPFYKRLSGTQDRSGRAENLVPTGIRYRTVQPVAQSLYRLSYRAHRPIKYVPQNTRLFNSPGHTRVIILPCFALGVINRYSSSTSCTPLTSTRRSSIIAIITKVEGAQ